MPSIKSFLLLTISIFIPIVLFEIGLRIDGRYSNLVSVDLYGSNTIWTRYPLETRTTKHPDKKINIEVKYNQYGSRDKTFKAVEGKGKKIGFFGDSFTENLRIENEFTFNSLLEELSIDSSYYNFGVDGFGTAQSFQRWLNVKDSLNLDMVIYIFCANDLRNTYEAQIFDRQLFSEGKIENIVPTEVPMHIALANSFHITYMTIEAYFKAKSILNRGSQLGVNLFNARLGDKYSKGWEDHREKFHNEYADTILEEFLTGNASSETLETVSHFQSIIKKWRQMVEMEGGKFHIVVLPRKVGTETAKKLFSNQEIIQLKSTKEIEELRFNSGVFTKDDHWNEYGNLAGAISLKEALSDREGLDFKTASVVWIKKKKAEIEKYYKK